MPRQNLTKSFALRLAALGSVLAILLPLSPAPAQAYACGRSSGCTSFELVSAGASYNWYPLVWRYEFKGGRKAPKQWDLSGAGREYQQNGMLTIVGNKGVHAKPVASTWSNVAYTQGRWESRMRTRTYGAGQHFRVQLALTPATKAARHCGAQDVTFLDYTPARKNTYHVEAHTLPAATFTYSKKLGRQIGDDEWHVFGVEVTKKHIAWFVDAHLVSLEDRPAALSGTAFTMQARLVPVDGASMEKTRLQLDWARYWSMKKKGRALGSAPSPTQHVNKTAC
ncbi:family 16 glycosylhydrolase [Nocardioides sp. Kera G14]|uniref:family 16 glycosylhydrolase n=1 Tax=Nocardioides sp. Kera G14 TaxID=2884264 RepID=UPI001D121121|nr:family 16 glycosylhydrolase [Nocardioides sp. Kera G14]UDY24236.1 family 16 glycosylhydrolase [Nocardioides sp. Kera G14]